MDLNLSFETIAKNVTFLEFVGNCLLYQKSNKEIIDFNVSKSLIFEVFYSPFSRISFIELEIQNTFINTENISEAELSVNAFVNSYRNCIVGTKSPSYVNKTHLDFICELKSFENYNKETQDLPNSIKFWFRSNKKFELKICRILVSKFQDDCGLPDIPLHAKSKYTGTNIYYYPSDEKRHEILGGEQDKTIRCLFEGNWDKDLPLIKSKIHCETNGLALNSSYVKSIEFHNFEYFNETKVAVIDSRIKYQCNNSENSSEIFVLFCSDNGLWIGDMHLCLNISNICIVLRVL